MKCARCIIVGLIILLGVGLLIWLGMMPVGQWNSKSAASDSARLGRPAIRIGLIPERDIFEQRRRYRALGDYVAAELGRPVELVTANSYENIIRDFGDRQIDAAFLGSLVAVLAVDRMNAQILVKPELPDKVSGYRGLVFVPSDSPVKSFDDLQGRTIAMVRTTTGGNLYPMYELFQRGLLNSAKPPKVLWVGTHDDVILEVAQGWADAGALKDLRLDEYEKTHAGQKFRRLGHSEMVPENGLVVRADIAPEIAESLRQTLLKMDSTAAGRKALQAFGAARFLSCQIGEYKAIYDMSEALAPVWEQTGIGGRPPKRPTSQPVHN